MLHDLCLRLGDALQAARLDFFARIVRKAGDDFRFAPERYTQERLLRELYEAIDALARRLEEAHNREEPLFGQVRHYALKVGKLLTALPTTLTGEAEEALLDLHDEKRPLHYAVELIRVLYDLLDRSTRDDEPNEAPPVDEASLEYLGLAVKQPRLVRVYCLQEDLRVPTAQGFAPANAGDYLLRDLQTGDQWPIRKDIFEETYAWVPGSPGNPR